MPIKDGVRVQNKRAEEGKNIADILTWSTNNSNDLEKKSNRLIVLKAKFAANANGAYTAQDIIELNEDITTFKDNLAAAVAAYNTLSPL